MTRPINFAAGPAAFPEDILQQVREEFLNWNGTHQSIVEIPHRGDAFKQLLSEAKNNLRNLLNIPSDYEILFITAPTRLQFSLIPMNFLGKNPKALYLNTGVWSQNAALEAEKYGEIRTLTLEEMSNLSDQDYLPYRYLHYADNETIDGIEFITPPLNGAIPLISDMTSNLLTKPIDVSQFSLIYAGTQKNIAPSGLTLVIIHHSLLSQRECLSTTPAIGRYYLMAEHNSLQATPNVFSCYFANLMFRWIIKQGGLEVLGAQNQKKSQLLYEYLDQSNLFENTISSNHRSRVNVIFSLKEPKLTTSFLEKAEKENLIGLKGHPLKGGVRVSLYNAITPTQVTYLVEFMRHFEETSYRPFF